MFCFTVTLLIFQFAVCSLQCIVIHMLVRLCDKGLTSTYTHERALKHSSRQGKPNNPAWEMKPPTQLLPGLSPASASTPWSRTGTPSTKSQGGCGPPCKLRGVAACQHLGFITGELEPVTE